MGDVRGKPYNGEKTRPLKPASIAILRQLAHGPMYGHEINPGSRDRLSREGLARRPDGQTAWFITEAGHARLAEINGKEPSHG